MRFTTGACKTQSKSQDSTEEHKYRSSSLGAAIPLRSAQTDLRNTIELQHATVEHIALMHQFQCTKCLNKCKAQKHGINKEEKEIEKV